MAAAAIVAAGRNGTHTLKYGRPFGLPMAAPSRRIAVVSKSDCRENIPIGGATMSRRDIPWSQPLEVTLRAGMDRTFGSVYEALDFLENEWPLQDGECYDRAVLACREA